MPPILSESSQAMFSDPGAVRTMDRHLLITGDRCRPLRLDGVTVNYHNIHIGPGLLPVSRPSGWHVHAEVQIEYAVFGQFAFETPSCRTAISPGQGLVIPGHREHCLSVLGDGVLVGVLVDVDGPQRDAFLGHVEAAANDGFLPFQGEDLESWTRQILERSANTRPQPWKTDLLADLLRIWLAESLSRALDLSRWMLPEDAAIAPLHSQHEALCDRALRFIRANCCRGIRPEEVAQHVGVSARHLSRMFRDVVGDSVNNVLVKMRMEEARSLLLDEPCLLVKEVADAAGYESPAYFTYCFQKTFGCSPRQARQMGQVADSR